MEFRSHMYINTYLKKIGTEAIHVTIIINYLFLLF
jgi:hypothetical protein